MFFYEFIQDRLNVYRHIEYNLFELSMVYAIYLLQVHELKTTPVDAIKDTIDLLPNLKAKLSPELLSRITF